MNSLVINPKALQAELFMTFFASRKILENYMLDPCISGDEFILDLKEIVDVPEGRKGKGLGMTHATFRWSRMLADARLRSTAISDYCSIFLDWLEHVEDSLQKDLHDRKLQDAGPDGSRLKS